MPRSFRRLLSVALAAAVLVPCGADFAQAGNCKNAVTQYEINDCAHRQFLKADKQLNSLWPGVKRSADQFGAGNALLEAQHKWIAFRDSACSAEAAPYAGGSIQPSVWSSCLERQTRRRIKDLKMFVN